MQSSWIFFLFSIAVLTRAQQQPPPTGQPGNPPQNFGPQGTQNGPQGQTGQQRPPNGQGPNQGNPNQLVCPRPNTPPGPCTNLCQADTQCQPGFKCCDTGCGRVCRRGIPPGQGNQRGPQQPLLPQPSLVGLGGCSRGATLRNPDGSTLVCGFGPRDFACPTNFDCVFDSILRALVCCPSDDATPPPTPSPPNPCPDGEPVKDEFNNALQCSAGAGSGISTCPSGTLCTAGACCRPQSVAGFLSIKPGQCPLPLPVGQNGPCANECSFDAECAGALKCCFVGCGARCVQVASENSNPASGASPPGSSPAGLNAQGQPIQGQNRGPNQPQGQNPFELVPTRNDGIFLQQQRGGFLGDQQGGGFAVGRGPNQQPQQGTRGQNGPFQNQGFQNQGLTGRALNDFASKSESIGKPILFSPGVAPVTANDTCEKASCPACHECSEATGIAHCVRMPDCCPDGSTPTACHVNPCPHTKCPDNPEAFCFPDGCSNVCRAVYYDRMGNVATCPTAANL